MTNIVFSKSLAYGENVWSTPYLTPHEARKLKKKLHEWFSDSRIFNIMLKLDYYVLFKVAIEFKTEGETATFLFLKSSGILQ